jgi:agmatinase
VQHSIQIGIRTIAPETCGIEIIDAYHCQEFGVSGMIDAIKQRVGQKSAYLTVDIDVLDPAFAPGTGTPVSGGLTSAQLLMTLNKIMDLDWRGMDIVEVAPAYDHADITAIAASTVVQHYLQGIAHRHK